MNIPRNDLPQMQPENAPPWAFWLETNNAWGWIWDEESWAHARKLVGEKIYRTTEAVNSLQRYGFESFGFATEHLDGKRTLRDYITEQKLDWMIQEADRV